MIFDGSIAAGERLNESTLAAHFGTAEDRSAKRCRRLVSKALSRSRATAAHSCGDSRPTRRKNSTTCARHSTTRSGASREHSPRRRKRHARDAFANDGQGSEGRRHPSLLSQQPALSRPPRHVRGEWQAPPKYTGTLRGGFHIFRLQGLYAGGAVPSNVEHWEILKAIQSGSAELAAAAMRAHIEAARARMLKAVKRR